MDLPSPAGSPKSPVVAMDVPSPAGSPKSPVVAMDVPSPVGSPKPPAAQSMDRSSSSNESGSDSSLSTIYFTKAEPSGDGRSGPPSPRSLPSTPPRSPGLVRPSSPEGSIQELPSVQDLKSESKIRMDPEHGQKISIQEVPLVNTDDLFCACCAFCCQCCWGKLTPEDDSVVCCYPCFRLYALVCRCCSSGKMHASRTAEKLTSKEEEEKEELEEGSEVQSPTNANLETRSKEKELQKEEEEEEEEAEVIEEGSEAKSRTNGHLETSSKEKEPQKEEEAEVIEEVSEVKDPTNSNLETSSKEKEPQKEKEEEDAEVIEEGSEVVHDYSSNT